MSQTLDQVGPIARTVMDCALMLSVMAGYDRHDPQSIQVAEHDYIGDIDRGVVGLRIGLEIDHFSDPRLSPLSRASAERAARELDALGANIIEVSIPSLDLMEPAFFAIVAVDLAAYHRRWLRERTERYAAATRRMLAFGELIPGVQYVTAQRVRRLVRDAFREVFNRNRLDAMVTIGPGAPAFPVSAAPEEVRLFDWPVLQAAGNMTGLPVISLPCGFTGDGLPLAYELYGRPFAEAMLFRVAAAYERAHPFHQHLPPIASSSSARREEDPPPRDEGGSSEQRSRDDEG
jgi:aspartyl-tRNA(Asn)/glutamyl-tRNA(Gln) amidotransferase subunit A